MKLLVSDLDGTLYPKKDIKNPKQFEENITAVKKWISQGNKFAVATARGRHHYDVLTEQLGMKVNFIAANGAEMIFESGETISKQLPITVFIDLCKFVIENNINASVATGLEGAWIWSSLDCYPENKRELFKASWEYIQVADLEAIDLSIGVEKIQVFTSSENRDKLKEMIIHRNYEAVVTTSDVDHIDVGPLNSSKGISILELCQKYNIDRKDLIVVGDSENDIPMFEITENSYCIDHAEEFVKEKSSKIVSSVKELIDLELIEVTSDGIQRIK